MTLYDLRNILKPMKLVEVDIEVRNDGERFDKHYIRVRYGSDRKVIIRKQIDNSCFDQSLCSRESKRKAESDAVVAVVDMMLKAGAYFLAHQTPDPPVSLSKGLAQAQAMPYQNYLKIIEEQKKEKEAKEREPFWEK